MSMLLTIAQPTQADFGGRPTHDFSPRFPLAKFRPSPKPAKVDSPVSTLRDGVRTDGRMTTPHRGLPPPSAMTLPDPSRPHGPSLVQSLGAIPPPPSQYQGQEEPMRNWLMAKAEEDKRRQEEEKTRQEDYRLQQRRIEAQMLQDALQGGVPPTMIPLIYAGIGGANLTNVSMDTMQQHAAQLQAAQQQLSHQGSPPELRRDTRLIGQAPSYTLGQSQQQVLPSQHVEQSQQPQPLQTTFSQYQPPTRPPPTSVPRSATHTQLPRLTTNEMYVQPQQPGPGSAHPLQQSQTVSDHSTSSPALYFHHWQPPDQSKGAPQTPASKGEPHSAHPGSHVSEGEYKDSPRKRKAQGPHERAPPPSAGPQYTSPSFSSGSMGSRGRPGHGRSRSNTSVREGDSRPDSRREPEPPRSSGQEAARPLEEPRERPREEYLPREGGTGRSSAELERLRDYRSGRPESREGS